MADENRRPKGGPKVAKQLQQRQQQLRREQRGGTTNATKGPGSRGGRQLSSIAAHAAITNDPPRAALRALRARNSPVSYAESDDEPDTKPEEDDVEVPATSLAAAKADAEKSRRAKPATTEELEELKLVDPSKYKRIVGNRKSAADSKARREHALNEAREECARLREENRRLVAALEMAHKKRAPGGGEGSKSKSKSATEKQVKPAKPRAR